ncbi:MAG: hypothetical protein H6597_02175 [Flavobacteriales bacterium]|nr:hypothetical protein [Flavobacteriales bacterium]MCB9193313.1 hypothetical protein [Flavobacteriales bacterium]
MTGPGIRSTWLRALLHAHLWLGIGAFAQVGLTCYLVPLQAHWVQVAAAAGLATVSAYGFMRLAGIPDGIAASDHLAWVHRHRQAMRTLVLVSGAGSAALLVPLAREAWWVALFLGPAIALYVMPIRIGALRGLRYVPFLKVFLIALVWSGVVVVFPFAAHRAEGSPLLWFLVVERACFVLAITLPFDVRDMHADDPAQRTIPQVFGPKATKLLALVFLLVSLVIITLVSITQGYHGALLGAGIGYLLTAVLILRSTSGRDAVHYNLLLDGTLIFVPVLALLGAYLPVP